MANPLLNEKAFTKAVTRTPDQAGWGLTGRQIDLESTDFGWPSFSIYSGQSAWPNHDRQWRNVGNHLFDGVARRGGHVWLVTSDNA